MTPTAYKALRRAVRQARDEYRAARRTVVAGSHDAGIVAREDRVGAALEARRWFFTLTARLTAATCDAPGSTYSPNAQARLRARGRLR